MNGDTSKIWKNLEECTAKQFVCVFTHNLMELMNTNMTACRLFFLNTTLTRMCPGIHSIPAWPNEALQRKKTNKCYSPSESLSISAVCPCTEWMSASGITLSTNFICWIAAEPWLVYNHSFHQRHQLTLPTLSFLIQAKPLCQWLCESVWIQ